MPVCRLAGMNEHQQQSRARTRRADDDLASASPLAAHSTLRQQQAPSEHNVANQRGLTPRQGLAAQDGFASLLDEIDGVLEGNAEEFVRSFVQKGGQ